MKRPLNEAEAFRAQELLMQRAMEGLSDGEAAELAALGADDDVSFDLAAAAIDIATIRYEDMPAGVADKILMTAGVQPAAAIPTTLAGVVPQRFAPSVAPTLSTIIPDSLRAPQPPQAPIVSLTEHREAKRSRAPMIIAYLAAAAGIALGVGAYLWKDAQVVEKVVIQNPPIKATPTPSQARAALLSSVGDVKTLAWTATPDEAAKGASGDVVWSPSKQEGYMRFKGLAANDPTKIQYQLWIFDKDRDDKYPVDGGVFDVGPDGEVVVKISPKLHVNEPVLFAVTVEAPGGVVVSKRERIVVTAAPPKTG